MTTNYSTISLGFTDQEFPAGVHVCQIFESDRERDESLKRFLLSGLQAGECTSCYAENVDQAALGAFFGRYGVSIDEARESGALTLAGTRGVYFQDNRFEPERMLTMLRQYYLDAVQQGYPAARVIGEMLPDVQHISGGERLLEYEARVSLLLREYPITAVCQYDARKFDGATIMDILKVHPLMVVRGSVVRNPFFISPEEYLSR
ncbi:MAG: MEDS domain-containing protein [Chloroflexota bacterium]